MIQQSYDSIINKIAASTGLNKEEIEQKVLDKMKSLQDLISKEGAAHIIANELKVKLFNNIQQKDMKIRDIMPGLNSIVIAGKVVSINEPRTFESKGRKGRVASLMLADETGTIRVTVWDEKLIDELKNLKEGTIIKVSNGYSKMNNNFKELHLGNQAQIIANPAGIEIGEIAKPGVRRKTIAEFNPDEVVETFGTIVQIFEPKYYQACPLCNKKVLLEEEGFRCGEHGIISPKQIPIVNFFLDDSTGNIRAVCFRDQADKLLGQNFSNFDVLKTQTLGKQIVVRGRISHNEAFNRNELVVFNIEEPNPAELIAELELKK